MFDDHWDFARPAPTEPRISEEAPPIASVHVQVTLQDGRVFMLDGSGGQHTKGSWVVENNLQDQAPRDSWMFLRKVPDGTSNLTLRIDRLAGLTMTEMPADG